MTLKVGRTHIHYGEFVGLTRLGNLKPADHPNEAIGFAAEELHSGRKVRSINGEFRYEGLHPEIPQKQMDKILSEVENEGESIFIIKGKMVKL